MNVIMIYIVKLSNGFPSPNMISLGANPLSSKVLSANRRPIPKGKMELEDLELALPPALEAVLEPTLLIALPILKTELMFGTSCVIRLDEFVIFQVFLYLGHRKLFCFVASFGLGVVLV